MKCLINKFFSSIINNTKIPILIVLLSSSGLIVLFVVLLFCLYYCTNLDNLILYISVWVAIANALLLYATLKSQNNGIQNEKESHRQEQFERTFFNMLETQRKLVDEISIQRTALNENLEECSYSIKGRQFFSFAINEILMIESALKSEHSEKYNRKNTDGCVMAFNEKWEEKVPASIHEEEKKRDWTKLEEIIRIEYSNYVYNISDIDRLKYQNNKNVPYDIFRQGLYYYFEHLIRNLYYLLQFVDEHQQATEAKQRYIKFIQSQMGRDELKIIEMHALSFPAFQEIIEKTQLTNFLE